MMSCKACSSGDNPGIQPHGEIQCLLPAPALEFSAQFPRHKLVCEAKEGDVFTAIVRIVDNKRTNTGVVLTISDGSQCLDLGTASLRVPRKNRKLQRVKKNYYLAIEDVVCEADCKLRAMETSRLTPLISSQPEFRALRRRLMCARRLELGVSPSKCFAPLMFVAELTFPREAVAEYWAATETFSQHAPSPSLADEVGDLLPLVESCSSLKKLGLAACRGTNDADLLQLAPSASSLQQLDLTDVTCADVSADRS